MLTGSQIREARALIGWSPAELARRALIALDVVEQAEGRDGTALLTYGQDIAIRRVCGTAGVAFTDRPPHAHLRGTQPHLVT